MQGKYLSVVKGKILDVVVDCKKNSKTYWEKLQNCFEGKKF